MPIGFSTGGFVDFGSLHQEFLFMLEAGFDPEAFGFNLPILNMSR
jgi:hypothetical protein